MDLLASNFKVNVAIRMMLAMGLSKLLSYFFITLFHLVIQKSVKADTVKHLLLSILGISKLPQVVFVRIRTTTSVLSFIPSVL